MSDPAHSERTSPASAALVAAAICAGMLALAIFVPPRPGTASPAPAAQRPLVDARGWTRAGELTTGTLRIDILIRADQRRYTVRDADGRIVAERIDGEELARRWGVDPLSLHGAGQTLMMVDPDHDALMGR